MAGRRLPGSLPPHPVLVAASGCAALAAWVSAGALAVTATTSATPRLGILPPAWLAPVLFGVAWAALRRLRPSDALPLFFTGALLLPWLPCPIPAAAALWTGTLGSWVWILAGAGLVFAAAPRFPEGPWADPRRAPLLASLLGFCLAAAGARAISGMAPTGDEPHYLILTQSLLKDGDLRIENNHAQRDYDEYYPGDLRPHSQVRGRNGEIYSIHAPGMPALLVPAFAAGGRDGAVLFLAALASLGGGLLWRVAHRLTGDLGAAWFAWAVAVLTAPSFFAAITVFPDALGSVLVMTGLAFLVRDEIRLEDEPPTGPAGLVLHGLGLAALPWMHSRFAPLAGVLGACIVLRLSRSPGTARRVGAFLALPVASAVLWLGFFYWIYGTPSPSAPYSMETFDAANVVRGFPGLFFDRRAGLLSHAPVMAFGLVGFLALARERRRLAIDLLFLTISYLLVVSGFGIWWGGASAPARLTTPIVPCLALAAAALWARAPRPTVRAWGVLLLTVSLLVSVMLAGRDGGQLLQSDRDGGAGWLAFVSDTGDLSRSVPGFVAEPTVSALARAAAWLAIAALGAWAVEIWARRGRSRGALALATASCFAMTVMAASTLGAGRGLPLAPTRAQMRLLQAYDPTSRPRGVVPFPPALLAPEAVLLGIRLNGDGEAGSGLALQGVPAGRYRVSRNDSAAGVVTRVRVGASRQPLAEGAVANHEPLLVRLAVDASHMTIESDGATPGAVPSLEPIEVVPASLRPTRSPALAAAGYEAAAVFALDRSVDLEQDGFWVGGGRTAEIVVEATDPAAPVGLRLRNAPVPNAFLLELGTWRWSRSVGPGEETFVALPRGPGVLRIGTSTGFRPHGTGDAARPRGRRGGRFLGAWVTVERAPGP